MSVINNEIDTLKKSENEFYTLAVNRLIKLAKGHNEISGAAVNFKQPAKEHQTSKLLNEPVERFQNQSIQPVMMIARKSAAMNEHQPKEYHDDC